MLLKAQMTSFTEMKNFWINIGMFSGATVYEMLAWHRIRLWHSGKMNILSRNEQSPVLIRALPPDTSAAKSSRKAPCCPVSTATTCSLGWVPSGSMVSGLACGWISNHKKLPKSMKCVLGASKIKISYLKHLQYQGNMGEKDWIR